MESQRRETGTQGEITRLLSSDKLQQDFMFHLQKKVKTKNNNKTPKLKPNPSPFWAFICLFSVWEESQQWGVKDVKDQARGVTGGPEGSLLASLILGCVCSTSSD